MKKNILMRHFIRETALNMIKENGVENFSKSEICKQLKIPYGSFYRIIGQSFESFMSEIIVFDDNNIKKITRKRVYPKLRKAQILNVAVDVAKNVGYNLLTRKRVSTAAEVSPALINRYFNTMDNLRQEVMKYAIQHEIIRIVANGLGTRCPYAQKAPAKLKSKVAELIKSL